MDHWCLFRSTWGDLWWMNHYLHTIRCNALILLFLLDHYILHFSNQSIFRWMIFEYAPSKAFNISLIVRFNGNVCKYISMSYKFCCSLQRRWNIHHMVLILKRFFLQIASWWVMYANVFLNLVISFHQFIQKTFKTGLWKPNSFIFCVDKVFAAAFVLQTRLVVK